MPRDMFGDVVTPSITVGTRKWYSVPLSIVVHAAALSALVVIPLLAADVLPTPSSMMAFAVPPPPPPPPAPAPPPPAALRPVVVSNPNVAPIVAPDDIKAEPPPTPLYSLAPMNIGVPGGFPTGTDGGVTGTPPPPPPPAPPKPEPVRPGGDLKEPVRVYTVDPKYPETARLARLEGYVVVEALIGKDGRVVSATALKPNAHFNDAALEAVRQWRYTPTTLGGQPVEVIMNVTVFFRMK